MINAKVPVCRMKLKLVQYNAASAITGAIRGTLKQKFCQELGLKRKKVIKGNIIFV